MATRQPTLRDTDTGKLASDEDFPSYQLTILAICRFSEPIAFNSILAYTYLLVQDLQGGDDANTSFYAGLLVSAYAVAEALTAMLWGAISDRYGRKPVVLLGLAGVALSSLMLGLAKKYWVALLARFIGGALNGNVAVMQTMVAEMVRNPAHEPKAYAVQPFVWALGSIVGSAMGGFLAQPAKFYPSVFPEDGIFAIYPYLLPNLVATIAIVAAVIQGALFLEETNPRFLRQGEPISQMADANIGEDTPLLGIIDRPKSAGENLRGAALNPTLPVDAASTSINKTFTFRHQCFAAIQSIRTFRDRVRRKPSSLHPAHSDQSYEGDTASKQLTFNLTVIMLTIVLALIAFHQMAFATILPVYLLDAPSLPVIPGGTRLDIYGGLGFTLHDVGVYTAMNGIIALFIQALIFPIFVEHVGVWNSFLLTVILYPLSYIVMPFLTLLLGSEPAWLLPLGIYLSLVQQVFFGIISGPCILILLKNATPSPLVLGKVNGFAMSATCAARTISPPLVGIIYSRGGSAAAWFSCSGFALLGTLQLRWVPRQESGVHEIGVKNTSEASDNSQEADITQTTIFGYSTIGD